MGAPYTTRRDFVAGATASAAFSLFAGLLESNVKARPDLTVGVTSDMKPMMNALASLIEVANVGFTLQVHELGGHSFKQYQNVRNGIANLDLLLVDVVFAESLSRESLFEPLDVTGSFFPRARQTCPTSNNKVDGKLLCAPFIVNPGMLYRKMNVTGGGPYRLRTLRNLVTATDHSLHWVAQLASPTADQEELVVCNLLEHVAACDPNLVNDGRMSFNDTETWKRAATTLREALWKDRRVDCLNDYSACFTVFREQDGIGYLRMWAKNYDSFKSHACCPPMIAELMYAGGDRNGVLGGLNVAVGANSRHKELAQRLVAALLDIKLQPLIAAYGFAPANTDAYTEEVIKQYPLLDTVYKAMEQCIIRPRALSYKHYLELMSGLAKAVLAPSGEIAPHLEAVGGSPYISVQNTT